MRVLVVGSGGREHALAWRLSQTPGIEVHAAPGNPGIARVGPCHPVRALDAEALLGLARSLATDLVVIGPEVPLVAGVADHLRHAGLRVFGPGRAAARIEGSKAFAKDVMETAGVPTARLLDRPRAPCVIKADGLAAGKGVVVCHTAAEVDAALVELAGFDGPLVIEELLEGPEVSLFAVCDGRNTVVLPTAQDFKRAYDGDAGPNTGGMGSYAPVPGITAADVSALVELSVTPVLGELANRDAHFVGTLFVGLMLTADGPRVLEYNCRFGDPETQSLMALLDGDLASLLGAAAQGELAGATIGSAAASAVTVVLAGGDYPASADQGSVIEGVEGAEATGAQVFHAGTALRDGVLVTNGGRILSVTASAADLGSARDAAYRAAAHISWDGMRMRSDIALSASAGGLRWPGS